jgi:serine 3-dehydrogenase
MYDLLGRTILITGASSGLGEAMARLFAQEGARLLLCGRRKSRLTSLADELKLAHDTEVLCMELDVRDREAVAQQLAHLPDEFRIIDALINNAGLSRGMEPIQEGRIDDWDEMIQTNVSGLLYVTRAILPGMVHRGHGDVINIGSISSHEVYPGGAVYCASKHAVDAITRGLRQDLVASPVRVSQISPGMVNTEFSQVRFHGDRARAEKVYQGIQPLMPEDVAQSALFILTRPVHMQVGEIVLWPTHQASTTLAHRDFSQEPSSLGTESSWRGAYELE